jgi:hypothetical protein
VGDFVWVMESMGKNILLGMSEMRKKMIFYFANSKNVHTFAPDFEREIRP